MNFVSRSFFFFFFRKDAYFTVKSRVRIFHCYPWVRNIQIVSEGIAFVRVTFVFIRIFIVDFAFIYNYVLKFCFVDLGNKRDSQSLEARKGKPFILRSFTLRSGIYAQLRFTCREFDFILRDVKICTCYSRLNLVGIVFWIQYVREV